MNPKNHHILMVNYWSAPMQSMGARRMYRFYRYFKGRGYDATVITSTNRDLVKKDEFEIDAGDLHTVPAWDFRWLHARLKPGQQGRDLSDVKKSRLYRLFSRASQSFPLYLLLGEGGASYIWNAYRRACRLIEEKNIGILITSYAPMTDHIVGYLLNRRYPYIRWVADFRDQHVDSYRHNAFMPSFQKKMDRYFLNDADLVTTVSRGLVQALGYLEKEILIVPNGLAEEEMKLPAYDESNHFTISYTGSLYPWQDARPLFRAVKKALDSNAIDPARLRIAYRGRDEKKWKEWLEECGLQTYIDTGLVMREEAIALQQSSQINLLLSWSHPDSKGVLTGKLFEYLQAGKPVFCLINGGAEDEMRSLIRLHPRSRLFDEHSGEDEILTALRGLYRDWLTQHSLYIEASLETKKIIGIDPALRKLESTLLPELFPPARVGAVKQVHPQG